MPYWVKEYKNDGYTMATRKKDRKTIETSIKNFKGGEYQESLVSGQDFTFIAKRNKPAIKPNEEGPIKVYVNQGKFMGAFEKESHARSYAQFLIRYHDTVWGEGYESSNNYNEVSL